MKSGFEILGTDYIKLITGNAKQAKHYYQTQFGFEPLAYKGLETGDRDEVAYVLRQNKITIVLVSPLTGTSPLNEHLRRHGDGIVDVAFRVEDAKQAWEYATSRGAEPALEPTIYEDTDGYVIISAIRTYGDTIHSFVERKKYRGIFFPGFIDYKSPIATTPVGLNFVDHFVGNQPENQMAKIAQWYEEKLGFHRFWTADDKDISTEYTALRSVVVANDNERIKMPINRPAVGLKKSQIEEFVEYYSGPGVQHVAFDTDDIVGTVHLLSENGVEFLKTPASYYEELPGRVGEIDEDIDRLAELGILVDIDEFGYMLQIFTAPVQDRPTLFYEVIQRKGSKSFGKGNFKALFEAIEREQARRGNL
jgi:4-hydroxyphenylpyruvate dioxygenase